MGKPLALWGLLPVANASFELDGDGDPPTGWTLSGAGQDQAVSDAEWQSAGLGLPSSRSLRQNVTDGTGGNQSRATQRLAIPEALAFLATDGGEIAAAAVCKAARPGAGLAARIELEQFSGGDESIGSGTPLAAAERRFDGAGSTWFLRVTAQALAATAEWVELSLVYDVDSAAFDADAHAYWDRVFAGGLLDLSRGFRRLRPRAAPQRAVNVGHGGAVEVLSLDAPRTELDIAVGNLVLGSIDEVAFRRFERWAENYAGTFALWGDRDRITNAEQHWQRLVIDGDVRTEWVGGGGVREYQYRCLAVSEGTA